MHIHIVVSTDDGQPILTSETTVDNDRLFLGLIGHLSELWEARALAKQAAATPEDEQTTSD